MYKIITARNHKELETAVNKSVDEGFLPVGGVAVAPGPMNSTFLYQAVSSVDTVVVIDAPEKTAEAPADKVSRKK